jgi:hypothetical protein
MEARIMSTNIKSLGSFVWSIAELLRGDFKQSEYGKVILPFVVLRRLDCILDSSKAAVLDMAASLPADMDDEARDTVLSGVVGENIKLYNLSRFTFESLKGQDAKDIHKNLIDYITKFSPNVRDIFLEKFLFTDQLKRLNDAGLLYLVFDRFTQIDLHPDAISNLEMGYLFEDLIRRFSEISNETAGEHYTPREVIRLIVALLLINDREALTGSGVIRQVYDPAAGTGGMLAIAEMEMKALNDRIREIQHPRAEQHSRPCGARHSWGRIRASCRKTQQAARSGICRSAPGESRVRGDRTSGRPRIPGEHGRAGTYPDGPVGPPGWSSALRRAGRAVSAPVDGARKQFRQGHPEPCANMVVPPRISIVRNDGKDQRRVSRPISADSSHQGNVRPERQHSCKKGEIKQ